MRDPAILEAQVQRPVLVVVAVERRHDARLGGEPAILQESSHRVRLEASVDQAREQLCPERAAALALDDLALDLQRHETGDLPKDAEIEQGGLRAGNDERDRPRRGDCDGHERDAVGGEPQDGGHRVLARARRVAERPDHRCRRVFGGGHHRDAALVVDHVDFDAEDAFDLGEERRPVASHDRVAQRLVQPERVQHARVLLAAVGLGDRARDGAEGHLERGEEQRYPALVGRGAHFRRHPRRVHPVPDRDAAEARVRDPLDPRALLPGVGRDTQPGRAQQVARAQPFRRVGQLADVRPRHLAVQSRAARVDPGPEIRQGHQVADGHGHAPLIPENKALVRFHIFAAFSADAPRRIRRFHGRRRGLAVRLGAKRRKAMLRVGVDVGGTFTDLFAWDDDAAEAGRVREAKVLTTPHDPSVGVMDAIAAANIDPSTIVTIVHGTTIATNALIERRYPEPALVTTQGFRDVLEIGSQRRRRVYDPYQVKGPPLIERSRRFTVAERMGADGTPVEPLDRDEARRVAERIAATGIQSVAVAFINAYRNGEHEEAMRDALLEVLPDAKVALSSQTRPKMRELGRFVTTAIRAALLPAVDDYIDRLQRKLEEAGCRAPLFIVKSNGGMMSGATARQRPEELIESGPAGGVAAASYLSDLLRQPSLIVTDVGGTSFEASMMEDGQGLVTDEYEIEWERPVITPMLDIRSIGAGGGSIAWIDDGGSLRVGPHSAGADPGPACYGRGGTRPTVTDANLVLGRIDPTLGGKFDLDLDAAVTAITSVAEPLGMSVLDCAEGIAQIVSENMAAAIRMVSTDRGRDPRDHVLVAFGGAGGLHAHHIAQSVGVERVLVPRFAGVGCAFGAIAMDIRHDVEATFYAATTEVDVQELNEAFAELERQVGALLEADGVDRADMTLDRTA